MRLNLRDVRHVDDVRAVYTLERGWQQSFEVSQCSLVQAPLPAERFDARVVKEPASVTFRDSSGKEVTLVIGKFDLQYVVAASISDPFRSRRLPEIYARMEAGDFSQAAPLVYEFVRKPGAISFRGMPEAMDAASGISSGRTQLVQEQARTSLLGDVLNFPIPHVGDAFGVPDLGDGFREPVRSNVPTLFLSGTLDGRTYTESAREIAARFANGTHVIVQNGGHNLFEASPLIREMIVAYMKGETPQVRNLDAAIAGVCAAGDHCDLADHKQVAPTVVCRMLGRRRRNASRRRGENKPVPVRGRLSLRRR